ncbi:hypothetical protein HDU87_002899 [Geranomyces variabilis]|uniref:Threonine/serine exporter-like N-terminal domain-containing protein n=1 Tax=Geranomyces variabilis TaxID=109894 RepID=A0AAD5TLF7_9FUNG|nr:hypothetical protein HDU87_002899 [Geranomyces variabilis]
MPHRLATSNLPERLYVPFDDIEASNGNLSREEEDEIGDITELAARPVPLLHGRDSPSPSVSSTSLSGWANLRRRLSVSGAGGRMSARPSTSSLLESVLMRSSVSRQPSFSQANSPGGGGFFPHATNAPSFSRLPIPWSSNGAPRDSRQADLLCGLALALSSYGAPLYRVEHRVSQAAEDLNLPVSVFCLPSTIMVSIGDGSARSPCRVQYLSYSYGVNVSKLYEIDRLARRVCATRKKMPLNAAETMRKRGASVSQANESMTSVALSAVEEGGAEKPTEDSLDICLSDLQQVLHSPGDYHRALKILAGAFQSGIIAVLLFKGSWADGLAAFCLGAFVSVALYVAELLGFEGAVELLASMCVAAIARFVEPWGIWALINGNDKGLCHEIVSLAGVCQMLPGTAITLGMLELGSTSPVAGSVRMFQAFVRALKLGYGLATGSKLAIHLIELVGVWVEPVVSPCPAAGQVIDLWRLPLWIPMNLSIMINLKAYPWQWVHMSLTSLTGYCDITAGMAAFTMAVVANLYARRNNDVAIGPILAGITWLVPGGIGVRGAIAAVSGSASTGGTTFGIDMITRAMSIAVGIYMANVVAFPIIVNQGQRDKLQDEIITM